ncbi:MAG: hypothetical protein SGARI_001915 [Bacillariaceae sp.]
MSLNRLFSEVSFLDNGSHNRDDTFPATLAANAIASVAKTAKPSLAKTLTMNKFPALPCAVSPQHRRSLASPSGKPANATAAKTFAGRANSSSKPATEDPTDSFGWFIDTDDGDANVDHTSKDPYASSTSSLAFKSSSSQGGTKDLAFQAPTAPKGKHDDAEIEWAQAADTVDSVLGDIF